MTRRLLALSFLPLAVLASCCTAESAEDCNAPADAMATGGTAVVNEYCMVNHEDTVKGGMAHAVLVADFQGQKVGFCCPGCVKKWASMSDAEKKKSYAEAMALNRKTR